MRDPFLILGEEAYLLSLKTASVTKTDVSVKRGEKALIDPSGYRIWYEYDGSLWKTLWGVCADSSLRWMADRIAGFHFLSRARESERPSR